MDVDIPAFSKQQLHQQLERLLNAFETKGINVKNSLLPGLSEQEIREQCAWFPGNIPEEIIALYEWRGGQDESLGDDRFVFRDNKFCSLKKAEAEYQSMMQFYGIIDESTGQETLKYSFPIASFDGAFYVIPTKSHSFDSALEKPIISVFQGFDIFYYSLEKMVETCVEWVQHENYEVTGLYPEEVELEIWQKHNPGIFSG
ncbi:MAG: hypothetical protein AAGG68_31410 [Bacteroidota bacterium]